MEFCTTPTNQSRRIDPFDMESQKGHSAPSKQSLIGQYENFLFPEDFLEQGESR